MAVARAGSRPRAVSGDSDGDDVDVNTRCEGQPAQVFSVGSENRVTVRRKQDDRSVDRVGFAGPTQQHTGTPAESIIERGDLDRPE